MLYLLVAVVSVRALGILRGVFRYLERVDGHQAALQQQTDLRLRTWQRLLERNWVGRRSGDLLSRVISDVDTIHEGVVRVLLPLVAAGVVAIAAICLLALILPGAAAWVGACILLSGVAIPRAGAQLSVRHQRTLAESQGQMSTLVAESADAVSDLIIYGARHGRLEQMAALSNRLRASELRLSSISGAVSLSQTIVDGAALVGALLLGVDALSAGRINGPLLTVVVLVPLALHEVVAAIPDALLAQTRTTAARRRVTELGVAGDPVRGLSQRSPGTSSLPQDDAPPASRGLRAIDLSVGHTASPVATNISFSLDPGSRLGVTGPSGAGKSTLAATLLGLLPPRAGTLEVRGSVGYLDQEAHLFDTTIAENVRIGRADADSAAVGRALRQAGIPLDHERLVGEHGRQVSGGEARRIALARVLIRDDDIIVLDEPTEHLDEPTAAELRQTLLNATQSRATIVISHDAALLERCDAILHLPATRETSPPPPVTAAATPTASTGATAMTAHTSLTVDD